MSTAALPKSSCAAVLVEYGSPLELRELPVPELEPGALLVKTEVTTICGTDVHLCAGELAVMNTPLPVVPGHEFVGRIVAFGAGADKDSVGQSLEVGDRIVWEHEVCGQCFACTIEQRPELCANRRYYMFTDVTDSPYLMGGFSEYVYVFPKSGRLRVPDEVKSEWAAASSCAQRTVMNAFERLPKIEPWDTVVIQGTGPLGLFAVLAAKRAGAGKIIAVGGPEERLNLAREYGADHLIPVEGTDPETRQREVAAVAERDGADVVMEFSGAPGAFSEGLSMLRRGGTFVVVGQVSDHEEAIVASRLTKNRTTILGSWSGGIKQYWQALQFIRRTCGEVDYDRLISGRYELGDVNEALANMASYSEIKAAVYPNGIHCS
jgi:D-arabinose 1-dehydrogenase-like Zn-dependent alcohol dehydrogenase